MPQLRQWIVPGLLLLGAIAAYGGVAAVISPAQSTFTVIYRFGIKAVPDTAHRIQAWVPAPASNSVQSVQLTIRDRERARSERSVREGVYGNTLLRFDLSGVKPGPDGRIWTEIEFRVSRRAYRAGAAVGAGEPPPPAPLLRRLLRPDRLVPIGGEVAREALRVAGEARSTEEKARRVYENLLAGVDEKAGCTAVHSAFIGQMRALKVPARFVTGLALPARGSFGRLAGHHCWAEYYDGTKGWVPVDLARAGRNPARRDQYFGGLDGHRVQLSVGRDVTILGAPGGPENFIFYPVVEIDGVRHQEVDTEFHFRRP